jgi:hypothetical protein
MAGAPESLPKRPVDAPPARELERWLRVHGHGQLAPSAAPFA